MFLPILNVQSNCQAFTTFGARLLATSAFGVCQYQSCSFISGGFVGIVVQERLGRMRVSDLLASSNYTDQGL